MQLLAGGVVNVPDEPLANLNTCTFFGQRVVVRQNITTTVNLGFGGVVEFATPGITLGSANIFFDGDINPTGALIFNLGAGGTLTYTDGTWNQGANPLTINGTGTFNIGNDASSTLTSLATFSMASGTIAMPDSANIVVNKNATFKVGKTSTAETVTVDNNAGNVTFLRGSTLSVGLGTVNDKLVKAAGDTGKIIVNNLARLTSYAGPAGATPSPCLPPPPASSTRPMASSS